VNYRPPSACKGKGAFLERRRGKIICNGHYGKSRRIVKEDKTKKEKVVSLLFLYSMKL
jgi:hypothetical protein